MNEWSQVESQRTPMVVEGVSIEVMVLQAKGSEAKDQLSSLLVKVYLFLAKVYLLLLNQSSSLVVLFLLVVGRILCFLHNLIVIFHCWKIQFLSFVVVVVVHLQCLRFQTKDLGFVVVFVVGKVTFLRKVFGIFLVLHLFLVQLC